MSAAIISIRRCQRWLSAAGMVLVLGACDRGPAPAALGPVRPIAAVPALDPAGRMTEDGIGKLARLCHLDELPFSSPQGGFGLLACGPSTDDPLAPAEFRFVHRDAVGEVEAALYVDRETWTATTDETPPRFWDGHVLTLDLPQESGGLLLIGNWNGQRFVTSSYRYASGEEDGLQLEWSGGGLLATTSVDGRRRLLAGDSDADQPDAFAQESLFCFDDDDGLEQRLRLAVDAEGEVTGLSYIGVTPTGDGSANVCAVEAFSDDGDTRWSRVDDATRKIAWDDGETRADGDVIEPSEVLLARDGGRYALDMRLRHSTFCGQSSVLASRIVIERDAKKCARVEF